MRASSWAFLAAVAAVALALMPAASGQTAYTIDAGTHLEFQIEAQAGQALTIDVVSDRPVDIILVRGGNASAYYAGQAQSIAAVINKTEAHMGFDLHDTEGLHLIVDNSPNPAGGAPGDAVAQATVTIVLEIIAAEPGAPSGQPDASSRGPWRALMFTAYWDLGVLGFAGVFLWLVIFAVAAAWSGRTDASKLAVVAGGVAGLAFLWALLPHPGMVSQVGLPMLIGAGAGYLGVQGTRTLPAGLRLAFLGAFIGAVLGLTIGHLVRGLWTDNGMLVLGGERFLDALFTIPATAVVTAALLKVIPAFVEALEDEERVAPEAQPTQGSTFMVTCLRCGTAITVNRSMKRYRVATDRFEFACPNCNSWMEWSEPKPAASA